MIAVVLFHFNPTWLSGGFAGVDVFFVISGFLMTGIISRGIEQDNFSILKFYVARANRIIPALAVLCLALLVFGWFYLTPIDYKTLGKHAAGSIGFLSNVLYWRESGYFHASSLEKWLLHTWSLSVEWQFYIIYPLILISVRKLFSVQAIKPVILLGTVLSFALCIYATYRWPTAAYYLLPTRAWEMMIGGVAYLYPLKAKESKKRVLEVIGLLFIVLSYVLVSSETPWPGYIALFPVLGSFLIIQAQQNNSLFTGNFVFQKLGLWSYSIYLWHWPLVVAIYYFSLEVYYIYIGMAFSILLGFLSHKYIERIRFGNSFIGFLSYFKFKPLYFVFFIGVLGSITYLLNGMDFRSASSSYSAIKVTERLRGNIGLSPVCEDSFTLSPECRTSDEPEILIWGDSYAMHLVTGILASNPNTRLIQLTKSSCGPFFDITKVGEGNFSNECLEFTKKVKEWLSSNESVKYVVVSSPFNYKSQKKVKFRNGEERNLKLGETKEQFIRTLTELEGMGVKPVIFSPPPQTDKNIGKCLDKALFFNDEMSTCNFKSDLISKEQVGIYQWLSELGASYKYINLSDYICSDGECKASLDGYFLYRDSGHLSYEGSKRLGEKVDFYKLINSDI